MEGDATAFPVAIRRIVDPAAEADGLRSAHGAPTAVWRHGDDALTGFGTAARLVFRGPDRVRDAAERWRRLVADAVVDSQVPGAAPIAFGAFAFADGSAADSVLLVPRAVLVERGGRAHVVETPVLHPGGPRTEPPAAAAFPPEAYERAVAAAVERIRAGDLEKVVLARDLVLESPGFRLEDALDVLAQRYRGAWIFAVDGVFGASPETLATVRGGLATSRVLAGTAARSDDPTADDASREALLGSPKNRFEHALAVDSLLLTLGGITTDLTIGRPFALGLPNVWHLATDATAEVAEGVGALDLVALLHPTAAVAGAPRAAALAAIAELEPFDRRRYAGPVGWIDGRGDGEWAIALRSAEVEGPDRVRAFAGAGVVAASDAHQELEETGWKFQPIQEALAAVATSR
ncbi:isochorismate synthase [Amnibacterium kyonggiense]|uniref:isochorismate synthase n=2 Tax=Amnibacterium kyonggiense TaxID=595671 RepID=A0A4R7FPH2_9MICO|nr:isochorismate synthase [Amnibacterium kyonggiense]